MSSSSQIFFTHSSSSHIPESKTISILNTSISYLNSFQTPYKLITAMSPIRLADIDSDRDGPDSPLWSGDEDDRMLRHCTQESTRPKIGREQPIDDIFNEPVAIVGIGKLMSPALSPEKLY